MRIFNMTDNMTTNTTTNFSLAKKVFTDIRYFFAFGFGAGLMPIAPGTFGTLAAIPIYLFLTMTLTLTPFWYLLTVFLLFLPGIWFAAVVGRDLKIADYPGIVWDEIVGFLLSMFLVPLSLLWIIAGFLLFRFFDILKPFPINLVDRKMKTGFGVMLDDVLAAVYASICLHLLIWISGY